MPASSLIPASRQLFARNGALIGKILGQSTRNCHAIAVPPRNRISFAEKVTLGIIISVVTWATPAWILYHVPEYQKEERNTYTGK